MKFWILDCNNCDLDKKKCLNVFFSPEIWIFCH